MLKLHCIVLAGGQIESHLQDASDSRGYKNFMLKLHCMVLAGGQIESHLQDASDSRGFWQERRKNNISTI